MNRPAGSAPDGERSAPPNLSRRRFLALGAGAVGVAATAVVGVRLIGGSDDSGSESPPASLPTADEATIAVGRRYIEVTPAEADAAALRAVLPTALTTASIGDDPETVARAVRQDFEEGAVVEIDGWQLSLTECRLAAIAAVS